MADRYGMETMDLGKNVECINDKLKKQLFARGTTSLAGAAAIFKRADFNRNGKLDKIEFEDCMGMLGLFLSTQDIGALFKFYDKDGDGNIDYEEFLIGLRGDLPKTRLDCVNRAFDILDRDHSGAVEISDLLGVYNAKKHPLYLQGKKTEEEILKEFLENFEGIKSGKDSIVTREEFIEYYRGISASCPTDEYFVEMMESAWMMNMKLDGTDEGRKKIAAYVDIIREKIKQKIRPTQEPKDGLIQLFKWFDTDESGELTIDEFGMALQRVGLSIERKDVRGLFEVFDTDASRAISIEEFATFVYPPE